MLENLIYAEYIGGIVVKILLSFALIASNIYIVFALRNERRKKKEITKLAQLNKDLGALYDLPIREVRRILNKFNS